MAQYKVISDRLSDFKDGEVIDAKAFGDSVQWLLDAGHIVEVSSKAAKSDDSVKE
jgi:hypothetical protein